MNYEKIMKLENIKEKINWNIAILWYWREGKSSLQFLRKLWAKNITILDKNEILEKEKGLKYITWEDYTKNLNTYDLIIKSPWISPYLNDLKWLEWKITTQTEIFCNNYSWKIIGITWTKWKSTISALTNLSLTNSWFETKLVWNIWNPVLDEIDILWDEKYDYIIYEMSSYMLEWFQPNLYIWYVNNIYDSHLQWHNWKENYTKAKLNILKNAKHKIVNNEINNWRVLDEQIAYFWEGSNILYKENWFFIDLKEIFKDENILLKWIHNRINILGIIAILKAISLDWIDFDNLIKWLKISLSSFWGLPYRLENIWVYNWITFINDALAAAPESTIAAINTYEQNIWTLLLWWQDYWFNFEQLIETIKNNKIDNLVLFPDTWEYIFWDLSNYDYDSEFILDLWNNYKPKILKTKNMQNAINFAYKNTSKWKIVLLSSWAPSYSLWKSYKEKWDLFNKYIKDLEYF